MPVKFWQTIIRFWFYLSYLITTVSLKTPLVCTRSGLYCVSKIEWMHSALMPYALRKIYDQPISFEILHIKIKSKIWNNIKLAEFQDLTEFPGFWDLKSNLLWKWMHSNGKVFRTCHNNFQWKMFPIS